MSDIDCIVAGGSIAGLAAAAALRDTGWSVLVVEPGQRTERRLAGELIHPAGVSGLQALGLYDPADFAEAVTIKGFAILPDEGQTSTAIRLRYGDTPKSDQSAMALDYSVLRQNLDRAARKQAHIRFCDGGRISAVDLADPMRPRVTVDAAGRSDTYTCRMLVVADGAASPVRAMAGISHTRRTISTISGYVVDDASLPCPGFGHVMIGGQALVLAYEIGGGRARVMFDQPLDASQSVSPDDLRNAIPQPFRDQVEQTMDRQKPLSFRSAEVVAEATSKGAVVLVGDAGGSCHPLTATGMTVGISDGLRLKEGLRRHPTDLRKALRHYDAARRKTQRSRRMVASALHDVCSRCDPELRVVRAGLIRYWRSDNRSASATMAILAMTDQRISSAFWQFLKVVRHGLVEYWRSGEARRVAPTARLVTALGSMTIQRMGASLRTR